MSRRRQRRSTPYGHTLYGRPLWYRKNANLSFTLLRNGHLPYKVKVGTREVILCPLQPPSMLSSTLLHRLGGLVCFWYRQPLKQHCPIPLRKPCTMHSREQCGSNSPNDICLEVPSRKREGRRRWDIDRHRVFQFQVQSTLFKA